jgi:hypothetical protein
LIVLCNRTGKDIRAAVEIEQAIKDERSRRVHEMADATKGRHGMRWRLGNAATTRHAATMCHESGIPTAFDPGSIVETMSRERSPGPARSSIPTRCDRDASPSETCRSQDITMK